LWPIHSTVYTAAFVPVLAIFMLSIADALQRGSRAARFEADAPKHLSERDAVTGCSIGGRSSRISQSIAIAVTVPWPCSIWITSRQSTMFTAMASAMLC
jgi:hypothetical protein